MSLSIIILAAGQGLRMNSNLPKVLNCVGGYPMLYHVLDLSYKLKPVFTTLVISSKLDGYKSKIKKKYPKTKFSYQKKQLGTADAVIAAFSDKKILQTDVTLILYADTPLVTYETLSKALKNFNKNNLDMQVLSMKPNDIENSYGRLIIKNGKLRKIVEKVELNSKQKNIDICNSGIMFLKTKYLYDKLKKISNNNNKKEYFLTDLVELFSKENFKLSYFEGIYEEFMGANDKKDLARLEAQFQDSMRSNFLKKGVTLIDPESVYFSKDTKIGKDVVIYPNVFIGPGVVIGDGVEVKSFSHLENSQIDDFSIIGPFARLRDEAEIRENSKIGNFVEIKKSKIDKNVKISHLSYVGDAEIKENTNIGAGTITCNYDGKKKNKTFIGENCFIGSNSSLIAPIKIQKNSTIGAGTVIDKNVKEKSVVYRKSELIKKVKK
jgi:bifunctional UDP-N-acetylglucosamine pyrophosphorylase/glucosamine-1-phosphate N-acetyltransferase